MAIVEREDITDPRVIGVLRQIHGGRVLDVGCVQRDPMNRFNPNWLHQYLYEVGNEILGVDIDAGGVETLRKSGYNVAVADAEVLDVDGRFDYVVAGELIEHLANPGRFLAAARDRLFSDGELIITTPNPWCWARIKHLIKRDGVPCNPEHTHYQDESTLEQLLARYDYEAEIRFIGPMSEGITRRLYRTPLHQVRRLGATQLLAVATPADE
jgi:2-polyprenyl-3-methyl-5-hydroxy-6-metoxy-1,4-benzoquinol methylase